MKHLWPCLLVAVVPVWAQSPVINDLPSREFGHAQLSNPIKSGTPNLIEGREFYGPSAIAFDTSVSPPILYVADGLNGRVLAWRNPLGLTKGDPADKIIGQRDRFTSIPQGPAGDLPSGLARPVALAVDGSGNLYVMDAANNRILRYPTPFNQTGDTLPVNLVIGQTSTTSGNQARTPVTGKTLALNTSNTRQDLNGYFGGMAFDSQGNLWVTDVGNHRVLRYSRQVLTDAPIEPAADVVLGQNTLFSAVDPRNDPTTHVQDTKTALFYPNSVAADGNNGLYITDAYARVVYYSNPGPANSQPGTASRILGILPALAQGQAPLLYPNQYSLAGGNQNGQANGISLCTFTYKGSLFVCDSNAHRIVRYDPSQWAPATPQTPSPPIVSVIGQPDLTNGCGSDTGRAKCTLPNRGLAEPDATTLTSPIAGAFDAAGNLWVCDFGNNRVLFFPANDSFLYSAATKVLGQADSSAGKNDAFNHNAPNLVEGRELWIFNGISGGGMAVDKNSNPPHLYIADTFNNRILGFRDARVVGADARSTLTAKADIVIGQPDLYRTIPNCAVAALNGPCTSGSSQSPNDTGLLRPIGVAVDAQGNLYVADSGNGRVLRFPAPFDHASEIQRANRVLGQTSFGQATLQTGQGTMRFPYGLVVFTDGNLGVSDSADNRVLIFRKAGGDFTNGQLASAVVGQSGYSSAVAAAGPAGLSNPSHLAADDSDRLFVTDTGNNRLMIFRSESGLTQGDARATEIDNLSQPVGVAVEPPPARGIWVASSGANAIYHLRDFDHLQGNSTDITQSVSSYPPIAVTLDSFGNPIVAEFTNRVSFFFPKLVYRNAANATSGSAQQVAPGMMIYVATLGTDITADSTPVLDPPWPPILSGIQVLVNGVQAPIFRVSSGLVFLVVPLATPSSGTVEFLVTRPATGQILGAGSFAMAPSAPGFFTSNSQGTGQIVASNFSDGSTNGPNHPVARGEILTLWLTGQGPGFQGTPPPDGQSPSGLLLTDVKPLVYVNGSTPLPDANVLASAMTVYPGVWIINIKIPSDPGPACVTGPSCDIPIYVRMRDTYSYYGGTAGADQQLKGSLFTTFRLKQ